jgi:hypothetical protein
VPPEARCTSAEVEGHDEPNAVATAQGRVGGGELVSTSDGSSAGCVSAPIISGGGNRSRSVARPVADASRSTGDGVGGQSIPPGRVLSKGVRVDDRWTVVEQRASIGESALFRVRDSVTGDPALLWWFREAGDAQAEARARQQHQSSGLVSYLDSGLLDGGRGGGFVCLAWDGTVLEAHRPVGVVAQHELARSLVANVLRLLADFDRAMVPAIGLVSPRTLWVDPDGGVRLVCLGGVNTPTAHHFDRLLTVREAASWASPEWRHGVDSPSADLWRLGSIVVWVFTGQRAEGNWAGGAQGGIPEGWHGFLQRTLTGPSVQRPVDELEQWVPRSHEHRPMVDERPGEFLRAEVLPAIAEPVRKAGEAAQRALGSAIESVEVEVRDRRGRLVAAIAATFVAAFLLATGLEGPLRVGSAAAVAATCSLLAVASGELRTLAARAAGLLIGVWWGARVLDVPLDGLGPLGVWCAAIVGGLAAAWVLVGPAGLTGGPPGSSVMSPSTEFVRGLGQVGVSVVAVLAAGAAASGERPPSVVLWAAFAAGVGCWDAWSHQHSGRLSPLTRSAVAVVVAPIMALMGSGADPWNTAIRRLIALGAGCWALAVLSFVMVPEGGVLRWAQDFFRDDAWQDQSQIALRASWLLPFALLLTVWLSVRVSRAVGGGRPASDTASWAVFVLAVAAAYYWTARGSVSPDPLHVVTVVGAVGLGLVTQRLHRLDAANRALPVVRDTAFTVAAVLLAVGGLLTASFWRLDHGAWVSTPGWQRITEVVVPPGLRPGSVADEQSSAVVVPIRRDQVIGERSIHPVPISSVDSIDE